MHYTYVLLCKDNKRNRTKFYIGSTSNLKKRIQQHKSKGVKTTKSFDIIEFIYCEVCKNKTDAEQREIQLKTGFGRGYIKKRVKNYLEKRD